MLYYEREGNWVSLAGGNTDKRSCPGAPPPPDGKFEDCWGEVFVDSYHVLTLQRFTRVLRIHNVSYIGIGKSN